MLLEAAPLKMFSKETLASVASCEALTAIDRLLPIGSEGNFAGFSALVADRIKHFFCCTGGLLTRRTALRAAFGFILKTVGSIEFLLTCGENELFVALLAHKGFVFEHVLTPLIGLFTLAPGRYGRHLCQYNALS